MASDFLNVNTSVTKSESAKKIFWIGLVWWILSYYFLSGTVFGRISIGAQLVEVSNVIPYMWKVVATLIYAIFALILMFENSKGRNDTKLLKYSTAIYFLVLCSSLILDGAKPQILSIVSAISTGLLVSSMMKRKLFTSAIFIVTFFQACYAIFYQKSGINILQSGEVLRAGGTFNHPYHLAILMLVATLLCLYQENNLKNPVLRSVFIIGISSFFCSLYLTWFRANIIALLGAMLFTIWHLMRNKKVLLVVIFIGILLCGSVFYFRTNNEVNAASASRSVEGRTIVWRKAIEEFSKYPLTGVGVSNLRFFTTTKSADPNIKHGNAHTEPKNFMLLMLCELGISGGVLALIIIYSGFIILKNSDQKDMAVLGGLWIAIITISIVDTPFGVSDRYVGNVCLGALLGLTIGANSARIESQE